MFRFVAKTWLYALIPVIFFWSFALWVLDNDEVFRDVLKDFLNPDKLL